MIKITWKNVALMALGFLLICGVLNANWAADAALIVDLPDVGAHSSPEVFSVGGTFCMLVGESGAYGFTPFSWDGDSWVTNTICDDGLDEDDTNTVAAVFNMSGEMYLIKGQYDGTITGWIWVTDEWVSNAAIEAGLPSDVGDISYPTVWEQGEEYHMLIGEYTGNAWNPYTWNGTEWEADTDIDAGLPFGYFNKPRAFYNPIRENYELILGSDGDLEYFYWNTNTWTENATAMEDITYVDDYFAATTPTMLGEQFILIHGNEVGTFVGYYLNESGAAAEVVPEMETTRISPTPNAHTSQNLAGYCNATDVDGDTVQYHYKWFIDGVVDNTGSTAAGKTEGVEELVDTILAVETSPEEVWILECTAEDDDGNSTALNSSATTIYDCTCATCDVCETRLVDALCTAVNLTANIPAAGGTCIDDPAMTSKTFDCKDYTITSDGTGSGVYLREQDHNTIQNCNFVDFDYGVYLDYGSDNNTIYNVNTTSNDLYGVLIHDNCDNNVIDWLISNTDGEGIQMDTGSDSTEISNTVVTATATSYGIDIDASDSTDITTSDVYSNAGSGIHLNDADSSLIYVNDIYSNTGDGIELDGDSDDNDFYTNTVYGNTGHQADVDSVTATGNTFYNNIFNATAGDVAEDAVAGNFWNTSLTEATSIIGKTHYGGNWYSDYTGRDTTGDGVGDTLDYDISGGFGIDELPLTYDYFPAVEWLPVATAGAGVAYVLYRVVRRGRRRR